MVTDDFLKWEIASMRKLGKLNQEIAWILVMEYGVSKKRVTDLIEEMDEEERSRR